MEEPSDELPRLPPEKLETFVRAFMLNRTRKYLKGWGVTPGSLTDKGVLKFLGKPIIMKDEKMRDLSREMEKYFGKDIKVIIDPSMEPGKIYLYSTIAPIAARLDKLYKN